MRVLRVQDAIGRGPYRPGFSARWSDPAWPVTNCPPWWEELGETMAFAHARMDGSLHYGCAFRSQEQLRAWFSPRELSALDRLGFGLATITPDVVVAETSRQIVIGTVAPLSSAPRIKLTSRLAEAA